MHVETMFRKKFRIKNVGLAAEFLNIWICQCPARITIDQEQYTHAILDKYFMYVGICNYAEYYLCLNMYIAMLFSHLTNTLHVSPISQTLR